MEGLNMSTNLERLVDKIHDIKNLEDVKKVLLDIIDELADDGFEDFTWEEVT